MPSGGVIGKCRVLDGIKSWFGGMGWETRPTFWWARSHKDDVEEGDEDGEDNAHTTVLGLADFVVSLPLVVAAAVGQQQHHRNFHEIPMKWMPSAAPMWKIFTRLCNVLEDNKKKCLSVAVALLANIVFQRQAI